MIVKMIDNIITTLSRGLCFAATAWLSAVLRRNETPHEVYWIIIPVIFICAGFGWSNHDRD